MILATVFPLDLFACATLPPTPGPEDSRSAAIGISLVIHPPPCLFGLAVQKTDITVYFIRLDEEKGQPRIGKIGTVHTIPARIHSNPVKHGLVSSAIERPYSSFRRYVEAGMYPAEWGQGAVDFEGMGQE